MVFFPSRWLVTSGSVSTTHVQYRWQKLRSKSFCCPVTAASRESVWETESYFLPTLTTRHKAEDSATSGQQNDCCSQAFKLNVFNTSPASHS